MVKKESLLYINFIGELVEVVLKSTQKIIHGNEDGVDESTHPIAIQGFLMDEDEEYYFLGDTMTSMSKAVRKDQIVCIQMLEQKTVFDEILEEMPVPNEDTERN